MIIAFYGDSLTEGTTGASYIDILAREFPDHTLLNLGKGGDTVISLLNRLLNLDHPEPSDIAFLWVGVNDVLVKTSYLYAIRRRLYRQPWSKTLDEFEHHYRSLLDLLTPATGRLLTIPPLFIGEDVDNPWNRELGEAGKMIMTLSHQYKKTEFLDLRQIFIRRLPQDIHPYEPKKILPLIIHTLMSKRGKEDSLDPRYHFTCDGIHLNKQGAEITARAFSERIRTLSANVQKR
jgi:lysophospholipase L1-like esterase